MKEGWNGNYFPRVLFFSFFKQMLTMLGPCEGSGTYGVEMF